MGIDRRRLIGYLELLEKTYFIHAAAPFTHNIDREISQRKKLYLADTGILNHLAQASSGQVFENQVYLQLMKLGQTQFFQRKSGAEIDFIFQENTAIEVKETPHANDYGTLNSRAAKIGLEQTYLIGKHPPGDGFKGFVCNCLAEGQRPEIFVAMETIIWLEVQRTEICSGALHLQPKHGHIYYKYFGALPLC